MSGEFLQKVTKDTKALTVEGMQDLFEYMSEFHGLTLTHSEMHDMIAACKPYMETPRPERIAFLEERNKNLTACLKASRGEAGRGVERIAGLELEVLRVNGIRVRACERIVEVERALKLCVIEFAYLVEQVGASAGGSVDRAYRAAQKALADTEPRTKDQGPKDQEQRTKDQGPRTRR